MKYSVCALASVCKENEYLLYEHVLHKKIILWSDQKKNKTKTKLNCF